jgi:hypothetical protein
VNKAQLFKIVTSSRCQVIGWDDAGNDGHRMVLAALIRAFDRSESALLCEPSLARKTLRPPDIVLIDPEVGVHTVEVKAVSLDQIESIAAGGQLTIRYAAGPHTGNPITQVRNAMFDIKDATVRAFAADVRVPFRYWVVFPNIRRGQWLARFGEGGFCPPEFIFGDELDPLDLSRRLGAADRERSSGPIMLCPLDQLEWVWKAFGDNSVLYASPIERQARRAEQGTLGALFDETADADKALSDEQQRLSAMNWDAGPRLVRGVAGSGKTIVLANNLARRLERMLVASSEGLFGDRPPRPRLLAVCFNRSLAPFIAKKIAIAFEQRTGRLPPAGTVEVCSFNTLMWKLTQAGLWRYCNVQDASDIVRALHYLGDLDQSRQLNPERLRALAYDAIYVDEGQDFLEEEFRLLKELCRVRDGGEPSLYVFYDDAQNLYGRARPNWQSLGLSMRGGRSFVMTTCFRNTAPIVEATFNVLYGSCAAAGAAVPTREFGDITTLEQKQLVARTNGLWRTRFASRDGDSPRLTIAQSAADESQRVVARLRWLLGEQMVRPQDILVLSHTRQRVLQLTDAIVAARLPAVSGLHIAFEDKDRPLGQVGKLTLSTVASAKGYDAFAVLLVSANEFPTDVTGRAHFYVGCTRAVEYLEIFASDSRGLAEEMRAVLRRMKP